MWNPRDANSSCLVTIHSRHRRQTTYHDSSQTLQCNSKLHRFDRLIKAHDRRLLWRGGTGMLTGQLELPWWAGRGGGRRIKKCIGVAVGIVLAAVVAIYGGNARCTPCSMEPHVFDCNSRISRSIFIILAPVERGMNTPQYRVIYLLNCSMSS